MAKLPDYVASSKPLPQENRIGWLMSTAATYAGIMLWFVFWIGVPTGGTKDDKLQIVLDQGIGVALVGLVLSALICHFLFYLVPGLLGMKTGRPLYIVGTSVFGANGGFILPGFLMGLLQFGWLAVNAFFSGFALVATFGYEEMSAAHLGVSIAWAIIAALVGLKGIQYVGKVATFLPIIPFAILLIMVASTISGVGNFDPAVLHSPAVADAETVAPAEDATPAGEADKIEAAAPAEGAAGEAVLAEAEAIAPAEEVVKTKSPLTAMGVILLICAYVVGFFATAGAAGCDFGMNNKDEKAIQMGGLVGVALPIVFTGACALLIVAGAIGSGKVEPSMLNIIDPNFMGALLGENTAKVCMFLLVVAAFPAACFSSFIAANSFKTTLPKVNPFITCGVGTLLSIALVVSGKAGDAAGVFTVIGASFGPICGAMMADYILAGCKWSGPRAGFNPAGWIAWLVGFLVGGYDLVATTPIGIPCPPVAAFIVGLVLYFILMSIGVKTPVVEIEEEGA